MMQLLQHRLVLLPRSESATPYRSCDCRCSSVSLQFARWMARLSGPLMLSACQHIRHWTEEGTCRLRKPQSQHVAWTPLFADAVLCIKPFKLIIVSEDGPVNPIAVLFNDLLGVYAVQTILALVCAAAICTIFRRPKDAHMYITVVYGREAYLAEEVQSIGRHGNTN